MAGRLTPGAIAAVIDGGDLDLKPVVQVLDVRPIHSEQERYRMVVSDGGGSVEALLAVQLNAVSKAGVLRPGSLIQLLEYFPNTVQNRKIIIVLNMEILFTESEMVGSSKSASMEPPKPRPNEALKTTKSNPLNSPANGFLPTIQPSYRPPPSYKNHGAMAKNEAPPRIIPIAALNPYQGRWAVKARVTAKGDLRRYNNARGDGKVFSFDLLDSDGGEIRVTCFNAVVDRFYNVVEVGKVYLVSKGSLKPANKDFNHLNNQWEIFLEASSVVELCADEDSSIPAQQFCFRPICEMEGMENNAIADVIGVVTAVNPSTTILRKNGMETQRRIINLKDASGRSVDVTLWGEFCNREGGELQEMLGSGNFPVLAVKAGKVSDFSGKTIGTISSTQLFINPNLPEAHSLRDWFERGGSNAASLSISKDSMPDLPGKRKTVAQIKDEGLGRGEKPDWITLKAAVSFVKTDTFCYTACPMMIGDRQCGKKVTKSAVAGGRWSCDRCDREFEECDYRYLLQAQVQDHSGLTWVTAFQEAGEEILGCSAKELYELKHDGDVDGDDRFGDIVRRSLFKQYVMKLKIKEEHYGEEQKVKITVVEAKKVEPSMECRYLIGGLAY